MATETKEKFYLVINRKNETNIMNKKEIIVEATTMIENMYFESGDALDADILHDLKTSKSFNLAVSILRMNKFNVK